jgi:hypothetical protein
MGLIFSISNYVENNQQKYLIAIIYNWALLVKNISQVTLLLFYNLMAV